jgi:DNA ligase D-like protein (predicted 3'-phosphoesterase)
MDLNKYNRIRNFSSTNEPKGELEESKNELVFVVQEHDASNLHYDFRLESDGLLKSWAIPKGPSMNPEEKRLAILVEDHPYGYKDFEGAIPEGNYGAGTVMVWDNGTYILDNVSDKEEAENKFKADFHKGHLSFILNGKKLKGEFALIRLKISQKNAWLLVKKKDQYAGSTDILKKNKSVISNLTLEEIRKTT